jgi:hypothetical protein
MLRRRRFAAITAVLCLALSACAGSGSVNTTNSGLIITTISPSTAPAGSTQFGLLLEGVGLDSSAAVHFGGDTLTPQPISVVCVGNTTPCPSAILVVVPAGDISTAGTVRVSVSEGAASSNAINFQVTSLPNGFGAPTLRSISPGVAAGGAGAEPLPLIVIASDVSAGVTVNFGSVSLVPQNPPTCNPGGPCGLLVVVPAAALATAQTVQVTASNPGSTGGTSDAANFLVAGPSTFPIDESVDNSSPPVPGNRASTYSAVAASGRFVAFDSTATNLAPGAAAAHSHVYLRDNCFGAPTTCTPQTTLVSMAAVGGAGAGGNVGSFRPVMSQDGRLVAFQSDDTNLVAGANQPVMQIYMRDTCQAILMPIPGCTPQTFLVSASASGTPGNAPSSAPAIVGSFSVFVAFQSAATNLLPTPVPASVQQIYLATLCVSQANGVPPGCQPGMAIQSTDADGNPGNKDSTNPSLSLSGQFLAFESLAGNLAPNVPGNSFRQVYAQAVCPSSSSVTVNPQFCNPSRGILAVSVDASGTLGTADSSTPAVGFTGAVVFATRAPNLLPPGTTSQQILVSSECYAPNAPCPTPQSFIVSADANGQPGQGDSFHPSASIGGVAFTSLASLLPGASGQQTYVRNVCQVAAPCLPLTTFLLSADSNGNPIGGDFAVTAGPFATFSTAGSNFAPGVPQVLLSAPLLGSAPQ